VKATPSWKVADAGEESFSLFRHLLNNYTLSLLLLGVVTTPTNLTSRVE